MNARLTISLSPILSIIKDFLVVVTEAGLWYDGPKLSDMCKDLGANFLLSPPEGFFDIDEDELFRILAEYCEEETRGEANVGFNTFAEEICDALTTGDALLTIDALMTGDALLPSDALLTGDSLIMGDAFVMGDALAIDDALDTSDALVIGDALAIGDDFARDDALDTANAGFFFVRVMFFSLFTRVI